MIRAAIYRAVRKKASNSSGNTITVYLPVIIREVGSAKNRLPRCKQRGLEKICNFNPFPLLIIYTGGKEDPIPPLSIPVMEDARLTICRINALRFIPPQIIKIVVCYSTTAEEPQIPLVVQPAYTVKPCARVVSVIKILYS